MLLVLIDSKELLLVIVRVEVCKRATSDDMVLVLVASNAAFDMIICSVPMAAEAVMVLMLVASNAPLDEIVLALVWSKAEFAVTVR